MNLFTPPTEIDIKEREETKQRVIEERQRVCEHNWFKYISRKGYPMYWYCPKCQLSWVYNSLLELESKITPVPQ